MKLDELTKSILKSVFSLALITLFAIFLIKVKSVIIYITISKILTLMMSPFSSFLKEKLRFNNPDWEIDVFCHVLDRLVDISVPKNIPSKIFAKLW